MVAPTDKPSSIAMNAILETLLQTAPIWRGKELVPDCKGLSTGFEELDSLLPGNGWPRGALTELLLQQQGIGELRLLIPTLATITGSEGWVVLVAPPYVPYAPALVNLGINVNQLIVLKPPALKDQWWAAEQALRAGSCKAVLFWPDSCNDQNLRRLQLAAEAGGATGFVFAPLARASHPSPAPLRITLSSVGDKLQARIIKRRGSLVEAPLLLSVGSVSAIAAQSAGRRGVAPTQPYARLPPRSRSILHFSKHYPNGGESKQIWDRVIAHGDIAKSVVNEGRR